MRFKLSIPKEPKHSEPVNCVGWTTADELYSIGDDHIINKSNLVNNEVQKLTELSNEFYPTDMHWFPKSNLGGKKSGVPDIFAMAASDGKDFRLKQQQKSIIITILTLGKFFIMSKNGKTEKSVEAHKGACICCKWSFDGTMLVTGGEDGQVKLWSKSGNLRSTLAQTSKKYPRNS